MTPTEVCIPREAMPQVDKQDYHTLFPWLEEQGVRYKIIVVNPRDLRGKQKVNRSKVRLLPDEVIRTKDLIISSDRRVLDGNHRWMAAVYRNYPFVPAIEIDRPFAEALDLLRSFPRVYAYGDGNFHPITN